LNLTRQDRLTILLEFYRDVENGLHDYNLRSENGTPIFGMGPAWHHPSYRRLRQLLPKLASKLPIPYWHVAEMYLRWRPNDARRIAFCPGCKRQFPSGKIGEVHKHGAKTSTLLPRIEKLVSQAILLELVGRGIEWLDESWEGGVFIPDEVQQVLARGEKRAA
jgi:hypothetical protein